MTKPTLQSHTHCQAAQANRTSQSLSKSVSFPTHERKENKKNGAQQNLYAMPFGTLRIAKPLCATQKARLIPTTRASPKPS